MNNLVYNLYMRIIYIEENIVKLKQYTETLKDREKELKDLIKIVKKLNNENNSI